MPFSKRFLIICAVLLLLILLIGQEDIFFRMLEWCFYIFDRLKMLLFVVLFIIMSVFR